MQLHAAFVKMRLLEMMETSVIACFCQKELGCIVSPASPVLDLADEGAQGGASRIAVVGGSKLSMLENLA